jgi:small subunit ribosomal protein S23e
VSCGASRSCPDEYLRSKPSGINAARKLRNHRRNQRWAQKSYKKAHLDSTYKALVLGGATMAKGIVLEKM